jgi:hypothetical protein
MLACTCMCLHVLARACMYLHVLACACMCLHVLACACMCMQMLESANSAVATTSVTHALFNTSSSILHKYATDR